MSYTAATACTPLPGKCSDDRVQLYSGSPGPVLICGRHAANLDADDYRAMRAAGTY